MDFAPSDRALDYQQRLTEFMVTRVLPAEEDYDAFRAAAGPGDHTVPPIVEELKAEARELGLWNLFLPAESGLTNTEYASLAEISGWSTEIAPEALNCSAPDTGNMETLHLFATEEQRRDWLQPLLEGEIRSAFSMTEPAVASSDARNIQTEIVRDGDEYVINGHKWWTSGANDPRCKILIVMGRTNPDAAPHQQQSMVLVPVDIPECRSCAPQAFSAGSTSPGTPRSSSTTYGFRRRTCWARKAAVSPSPKPGWAPAASTTACARSGSPSGRWR